MAGLDYYSPWYHRGPVLHISLGLLVLLLMSLRVLWRSNNKTPVQLPGISSSNQRVANIVKIALYVFTFIICISGYFITTADGKSASFFGVLSFPAMIKLSSTTADLAGLIHEIMAWSIVGIASLHGSAALYHHFVKRDRTLVRMLKVRMLNPVKKAD